MDIFAMIAIRDIAVDPIPHLFPYLHKTYNDYSHTYSKTIRYNIIFSVFQFFLNVFCYWFSFLWISISFVKRLIVFRSQFWSHFSFCCQISNLDSEWEKSEKNNRNLWVNNEKNEKKIFSTKLYVKECSNLPIAMTKVYPISQYQKLNHIFNI